MRTIMRMAMRCPIVALIWCGCLFIGPTGYSADKKPAFVVSAGAGMNVLNSNELARTAIDLHLIAHGCDSGANRYYGLAGMPIKVIVRVTNVSVHYGYGDPVHIASNWIDQVELTVSRPSGTIVTNMMPAFLSYSGYDPAYELNGVWLTDEAATAGAYGDYDISVRWRGLVVADACSISFRVPVGDVEKARVQLARANAYTCKGEYSRAIPLLDEIISVHGQRFGYGYLWVLAEKGDALFFSDRLEEALSVKKACLALLDNANDESGMRRQAMRMHIALIEARIQERKASAPK